MSDIRTDGGPAATDGVYGFAHDPHDQRLEDAIVRTNCISYMPDYQAGGDCVNCGRVREDHAEFAALTPPETDDAAQLREELARLREALEATKICLQGVLNREKAELERAKVAKRELADAVKALETVADSLDSALNNVRYQPGDHPVVPIKHDTFVGAVRLIASAARAASSQGGE